MSLKSYCIFEWLTGGNTRVRDGLGMNSGMENSISESEERSFEYFFLELGSIDDPKIHQLQQALTRNMPAIRDCVRRTVGEDSSLNEYIDRLYSRLRGALMSGREINDTAIRSRLVSLLHEDRRRAHKRFHQEGFSMLERQPDPNSLDFVTKLIRKDQLKCFRDCLDPWTRQVFDLRFSRPSPLRPNDLAARLNMRPNTFHQRWRRGLEAGLTKYRERHG